MKMSNENRRPQRPLKWLQIIDRFGEKHLINLDTVRYLFPVTGEGGLEQTALVFEHLKTPRYIHINFDAIARIIAARG